MKESYLSLIETTFEWGNVHAMDCTEAESWAPKRGATFGDRRIRGHAATRHDAGTILVDAALISSSFT